MGRLTAALANGDRILRDIPETWREPATCSVTDSLLEIAPGVFVASSVILSLEYDVGGAG